MPESAILDLLAEDVTEPSWDELAHAMLGGEPGDQPDTFPSCSSPLGDCETGWDWTGASGD